MAPNAQSGNKLTYVLVPLLVAEAVLIGLVWTVTGSPKMVAATMAALLVIVPVATAVARRRSAPRQTASSTHRAGSDIWEPLAGPAAAEHYRLVLAWNRTSIIAYVAGVTFAAVCGFTLRNHHHIGAVWAGSLAGAAWFLGCVATTGRMRQWFAFRNAAREFWNVTPAERRDFVCRSPELLRGWISANRSSGAAH